MKNKGCGCHMRKHVQILLPLVLVCLFLLGYTAAADMIPIRSYIAFGSWEQDGNKENGPERITWIVVAQNEEENSICLLADKCLCAMPFSASDGADWPESEVCRWLNGEFLQKAFMAGDRDLILLHETNGYAQRVFVPDTQEWTRLSKVLNTSVLKAQGTFVSNSQSPGGQIQGYWLADSAEPDEPNGLRHWAVLADGVPTADSISAVYGVRPMIWVSLNQGVTTPGPSPAPTPYARKIPGNQNAVEVLPEHVKASSYITGQKSKVPYPPSNLVDGHEDTSWQFSAKGDALGREYVRFDFQTPVTVDELWIKNGYWKYTNGHDQYTRNSRPKAITVLYTFAGDTGVSDSETFTLKDDKKRKDWQKLSLGRHDHVVSIVIRVDSMYKGTKYPNDVCISEIKWIWYPK